MKSKDIIIKIFTRLTPLCVFLISACATNASLPSNEGKSKVPLVHKFDGYEVFITNVDIETGQTTGKPIRMGNGTTIWSENIGSGFGRKMIRPGYYALTERIISRNFGYSVQANMICYEKAAPVFYVKENGINVLEDFETFKDRFENGKHTDRAKTFSKHLEKLFTANSIEEKPQLVETIGIVSFEKSKSLGFMKGKCATSEKIKITDKTLIRPS